MGGACFPTVEAVVTVAVVVVVVVIVVAGGVEMGGVLTNAVISAAVTFITELTNLLVVGLLAEGFFS